MYRDLAAAIAYSRHTTDPRTVQRQLEHDHAIRHEARRARNERIRRTVERFRYRGRPSADRHIAWSSAAQRAQPC